jgi:predicted DNA-binding protein
MEGDIGFHFTIPPELLAKLKARAKQQGVTVAGLLRTIIKREVGKL